MNQTIRKTLKQGLAFTGFVIALSACGTYQGPGGYGDYGPDVYQEPQVYIEGCWDFIDANGVRQTNYVEVFDEFTIIVDPISRGGQPVQFELVSENLYGSTGSGVHTYRFGTNGRAIYRNNAKNRTFSLTYSSSRC